MKIFLMLVIVLGWFINFALNFTTYGQMTEVEELVKSIELNNHIPDQETFPAEIVPMEVSPKEPEVLSQIEVTGAVTRLLHKEVEKATQTALAEKTANIKEANKTADEAITLRRERNYSKFKGFYESGSFGNSQITLTNLLSDTSAEIDYPSRILTVLRANKDKYSVSQNLTTLQLIGELLSYSLVATNESGVETNIKEAIDQLSEIELEVFSKLEAEMLKFFESDFSTVTLSRVVSSDAYAEYSSVISLGLLPKQHLNSELSKQSAIALQKILSIAKTNSDKLPSVNKLQPNEITAKKGVSGNIELSKIEVSRFLKLLNDAVIVQFFEHTGINYVEVDSVRSALLNYMKDAYSCQRKLYNFWALGRCYLAESSSQWPGVLGAIEPSLLETLVASLYHEVSTKRSSEEQNTARRLSLVRSFLQQGKVTINNF